MAPRLSVVLAVHGGAERLPAVLDALRPQCGEGIQVLVCFAEPEPGVAETCRGEPWLTPLPGAPGSLVPHLWRDGILRAEAPRVALTVVHCVPEPEWIEALLEADLERYSGVGGAIDNDPDANARDWAVYLLRYVRYARPFSRRETSDLPGDNVVYDRGGLIAHAEAFADGFWEPSIHARLIGDGRSLLLDPAISVVHHNAYEFLEFVRLRFAHGRRYGCDRAVGMASAMRWLYLIAAPAVPLVLGAKVVGAAVARHETRRALLRAVPALCVFITSWAAGEACGVLDAIRGDLS